jgi:hypothetical protein
VFFNFLSSLCIRYHNGSKNYIKRLCCPLLIWYYSIPKRCRRNFSTAQIWKSKLNQICTLMTGTPTNLSIFLKYGIGFHSSGTRSFKMSTAHSTHGPLATWISVLTPHLH